VCVRCANGGTVSWTRLAEQPRLQLLESQKLEPGLYLDSASLCSQGALWVIFVLRLGSFREEPKQDHQHAKVFPCHGQRLERSTSWDPSGQQHSSSMWSRQGVQAWCILEICSPKVRGKTATSWAPLDPAGKGLTS
jgi:hypothetical protein